MGGNMRLIDADELIDSLKRLKKAEEDSGDKVRAGMVQNAIYHVDVMPVYEVVTCGDCKYYRKSKYFADHMVCEYHLGHTYYTEPERFCSHGERRTDEQKRL